MGIPPKPLITGEKNDIRHIGPKILTYFYRKKYALGPKGPKIRDPLLSEGFAKGVVVGRIGQEVVERH